MPSHASGSVRETTPGAVDHPRQDDAPADQADRLPESRHRAAQPKRIHARTRQRDTAGIPGHRPLERDTPHGLAAHAHGLPPPTAPSLPPLAPLPPSPPPQT